MRGELHLQESPYQAWLIEQGRFVVETLRNEKPCLLEDSQGRGHAEVGAVVRVENGAAVLVTRWRR